MIKSWVSLILKVVGGVWSYLEVRKMICFKANVFVTIVPTIQWFTCFYMKGLGSCGYECDVALTKIFIELCIHILADAKITYSII